MIEGPLDELLARYALPLYRIEADPGQDARRGQARERGFVATPWVDRVAEQPAGCIGVGHGRGGRLGRPIARWSSRRVSAWRSSSGSGRRSRMSSSVSSGGDSRVRRRRWHEGRDASCSARSCSSRGARYGCRWWPVCSCSSASPRRCWRSSCRRSSRRPAGDQLAIDPDPATRRRPRRSNRSGRTSPSSGRSQRSSWRWARSPRNGSRHGRVHPVEDRRHAARS